MMINIRKLVNGLLHDKDEFHKDNTLKSKVELHNFLLEKLINLEQEIVPEKIKYFWVNKKTFLFRLFLKFIAVLSFITGVLFIAWFFGFRYNPEPAKADKFVVLYVTEDADTNYIKSEIPKARFIILYPPNPHKDWEAFKEAMHSKFETPGYSDSASYSARRWELDKKGNKVPSQFWGRYQMGKQARESCGVGGMDWEEFSTNPEIQEGAFKCWIRKLYRDMAPYITRYNGRFMAGHQITASGIVSMTHNVGQEKTIIFLRSKGDTIPSDGDGINTPKTEATRFLNLGGYNLTSILE